LVESTVPQGYNKAADSTFTIAGNDYTTTNLEQTTTVTNQSGTELPSTGGIGTTIFYIIGAILVIGAGVVLVTRRRMNVQ
jgi:LPXTG-motif cell wall-anchored protein